ncbi:MAG: acyltransferase [Actinobacteria bacterium]|nr:acyltransferase [Actinomycetota bacterium]
MDQHRQSATHLTGGELLRTPLVFGDASRLQVAETADVNDALFNLSSGSITVEPYAFFGHRVTLLTGTHDITRFDLERQTTVPAGGRDIVVGRGAWVASGAIVIGPCVIGSHAVVGAGAVVTQDVGAGQIVAGVPARVIGVVDLQDAPPGPAGVTAP